MKKLILVIIVFFSFGIAKSYATNENYDVVVDVILRAVDPDMCTINPWWMFWRDKYTYEYVTTTRNYDEENEVLEFYTQCYLPGNKNCTPVHYLFQGPKNNLGVEIYDQTYLENRTNMMHEYAMEKFLNQGITSGNCAFNEYYNGNMIYQNVSWNSNGSNIEIKMNVITIN